MILQVLQTIPWDLVDIEMISVETDLAGLVMEGSRLDATKFCKFIEHIFSRDEIIQYMAEVGYIHRYFR